MTSVIGVGTATSPITSLLSSTGPLSVAAALTKLRLRPGSTVEISDSVANIQKNLDAMQGVAARITSLTTTDAEAKLTVGVAQYRKNATILGTWGAGAGQTVDVTGVAAGSATRFAAEKADWVGGFSVTDSSSNLSRFLDDLQSLVVAGSLRQIVHSGPSTSLTLTAAQLAADGDALAAIKNGAYSLSIRNASVSDTLGLDGQSALIAHAKVKAVHVKDTTEAIEDNLDALGRAGLRVRSIAQTDAGTDALTVSASQLSTHAVVIGKILTPYHLDVVRASASQTARLAFNRKVESISVEDTAANIAKRWSLLNRVSDSLASVEVTDSSNPISLTADQLAAGTAALAKFTVDGTHGYSLSIRNVKAGLAASVAATDRVESVHVTDTAANIATNLADLKAVNAAGQLRTVAVYGRVQNVSLDASQLLGDEATTTLGVFDKVTSRNVGIGVTDATMDQLDDLAAHDRVVSIGVKASSDEIEAGLDSLVALGRRLGRIDQTDEGAVLDLTQSAYESGLAVLDRVAGGYRVNLTGATASQAALAAANSHVVSVSVADTGRNLSAYWRPLRSMGATLAGVAQTDAGALSVSAAAYQVGQADGLLAKFSADQRFTVTGASVAQALQLAADDAVEHIDLFDAGSVLTTRLAELADLNAGGKLRSIVLEPTSTRLALTAGQLDDAQDLLALVKDGRYTLALDEVSVSQLAALMAAYTKIASVKVSGDAAEIVDHLDDLGAAGSRLASITRTDDADTALSLSGASFEAHRATLARISGGYQAELTGVSAAKASALALASQVKSLQVSDSAANLSAAWNGLDTLGSKLAGIEQTDSALLTLTATQWAAGRELADSFSTTPGVTITGAAVGDLEGLDADAAVQEIRLRDSAEAISVAWSDLAASAKITQLQITDPSTELELSASAYGGAADLVGRIVGDRLIALSDVAVADAASFDADTSVTSLDVTGSSGEIAAAFDTLGSLGKLSSLALSDDGGTLSLTAAQVLSGADTLAKLSTGYQVAASGAAMADLADLADVDNLASIGVSDSAALVADGLDELTALGSRLASIHLSDDSPVLALTEAEWTAGSAALAKIDGSYQVDLSQVLPSSVATLDAEATVRELAVAGTAEGIALDWSALVAAWNDGNGKLAAITVTDGIALSLTEAQQTEGAAMIAALLANQSIVTAT